MSESASHVSATLAIALEHATRLLAVDPVKAEQQSRAILDAVPGHPHALLLLGIALRNKGDTSGARAVLEPLAKSQPKSAPTHAELGLVLASLGDTEGAIAALSRAVKINPKLTQVWQTLGDLYTLSGDTQSADNAYAQHIKTSVNDPKLLEAAAALSDNKLAIAERLLREFLKKHPTDVPAMRMLAEVGARLGHNEDAEHLLARCLELAPSFTVARSNYATVLYRQNKCVEAIAELDLLLKGEPRHPGYYNLKAASLARIGEYEQAADAYRTVLKAHPDLPKVWMSYGHTLKTIGKTAESIAAYRKTMALAPNLGEAYWSLANLKTFRFAPDEFDAMRGELKKKSLTDEDRFHLHFALGKALEDEKHYEESFEHYAKGNAMRRKGIQYDARETTSYVRRSKAFFTAGLFRANAGNGDPAPDPIFIVGLPRSGSTLLEQILSSHSRVEGTMELPDVISIVRKLSGRKKRSDVSAYPEALATFRPDEIRVLGTQYLERTRVQRKSARPFFIDKTPHNFLHVGLIHVMLPNAKIIDARRHPMSCGFSCFKQHFARGHNFSYDLGELGHYYADYVELMSHFDTVLPDRIHRVFYERMVEDPEGEIRALLRYCGLPFEEACLRFYETERAVRTPSSEQVRQPIFADAVDQWRNYEKWLGPLKDALGPVLESYPAPPKF